MSELPRQLETAAGWLRDAERIVVFTGAGISAESGIATFRDADGFWQKYPPEQFATWDGLLNQSARDPASLVDFLLELLTPIAQAEPNTGHLALAALEQHRPVTLITQNVDRLHQQAGSRSVKEIHGTLFEIVSEDGNWLGNLSRPELLKVVRAIQAAKDSCFKQTSLAVVVRPMLGLGPEGFYRPNLVLFGDGMNEPDWTESLAAAQSCDVFLTVGTSGLVLPAAMLPREAAAHGAKCIAIDPAEESGDLWLKGTAAQVVPALVEAAFPR
jgi:NAD-dependent deacetylase